MKTRVTVDLFKSVLVAVVAILFGSAATAQTGPTAAPAAPAAPKLQAELLKTIDAGHTKAGDEVTAKTITPLDFAGTKFAPGAIVKGHVTDAAPDHLSLVFDSITVKKNSTPVGLSLRAVMMPHAQGTPISPRAETGGNNTGIDVATTQPRGRGDMLRSPTAAAEDSSNTVFRGPDASASKAAPANAPVNATTGDVIGLDGVQLKVTDDPKAGATFHATKNQKLQLEKGLQLMLFVSLPK
jgi:hypothetical protein